MNDYGAAYLWQRATQSIMMAVKYLPMDNTMEHALGSVPIGGMTGVPECLLEASMPKLAELTELASTFAPDSNFQITPASAAVMMEECVCLLPKEDMTIVHHTEPAAEGSRYPGKIWVAIRIAGFMAVIPHLRLATYARHAVSPSAGAGIDISVGVRLETGEIELPNGTRIQEALLEELVRFNDLPSDTHTTVGYFTPKYVPFIAEGLRTVLQTMRLPDFGPAMCLWNNFTVNPLHNKDSFSYILDLKSLHPIHQDERLGQTLLACLEEAFHRAENLSLIHI